MSQFKFIISRQQQVLTHLGYYAGKIDGIWGPKCIEAKKAFENSGKFNPGLPNGGLPFADKPPYPKGIIRGKYNLMEVVGVPVENLPATELSEKEFKKIQDIITVSKVESLGRTPKAPTYTEEDLSEGEVLVVEG